MKRAKTFTLAAITALLCLANAAQAASSTDNAAQSSQAVFIGGEETPLVQYNIGGLNYVRLRDFAYVLRSTQNEFSIGYYNGEVNIVLGKHYYPAGTELAPLPSQSSVSQSSDILLINGKKTDITALKINNGNYYKLRDLTTALGLGIAYDSAVNAVFVSGTAVFGLKLGDNALYANELLGYPQAEKQDTFGLWRVYSVKNNFTLVRFASDQAVFLYTNENTSIPNCDTYYLDPSSGANYACSIGYAGASSPETTETLVVWLTNAFRTHNGLNPLEASGSLAAAAKAHSSDMAENFYFSHTGQNGSSPADRAKKAGFSGAYIGENIIAGYDSAVSSVDGWINSQGHRTNILGDYAVTGVGWALGGALGDCGTQLFGR